MSEPYSQKTAYQIFTSTVPHRISRLSQLRQVLLLIPLFTFSGCCTTYFHDDQQTNQSITQTEQLPYSATQHDGIVNMLRDEQNVDLSSACGPTGWKTIKTETTLKDIVIRAIANPIWGTATIEYQCDDDPIAQVENASTTQNHHYQ